jgi:hypothetical protein
MGLSPELLAIAKSVQEANEALAGVLAKLNAEPNVTRVDAAVGVADQASAAPAGPSRRLLSMDERHDMQDRLHKLNNRQLMQFFFEQMRQKDTGVPLGNWLNQGGYAAQQAFAGINNQVDPDIAKAIDTGGAAALIRQDLEPVLYELFVRQFPAYDRIPKEPANGLVHAFNQIVSFGDAKFMPELGTVTDDQSEYVRKTTNIAILATRRGVSLKSQFAVLAGGAGYNPEQLELQGGLRAMAHRMQTQIFSGQATVTGGTYADEYGAYDANAFDGLRYLLGVVQNNAINVDPATNPSTTGNVRRAVDAAILPVIQSGGDAGSLEIWSYPNEKQAWDEQQDANVRYMEANQRVIGVVANAVNTIAGPVPWNILAGDSIDPTVGHTGYAPGSHYSGATAVRDTYILDMNSMSLPYLGTEGPTVLDIPIGISGQLTHLFVIFLMNGLALKAPAWDNKLRVKIA